MKPLSEMEPDDLVDEVKFLRKFIQESNAILKQKLLDQGQEVRGYFALCDRINDHGDAFLSQPAYVRLKGLIDG